jgi:glycerophosphoryl diester phosphodiesterase
MGGIEGRIYTNSREAWKSSYDRGYRVMEVDLRFLKDGTLVCTHEAPGDSEVANFRSSLVLGRFASVTATDLAALMVDYPDVWVMVDFKLGPGLQKQALSELRSILGGDTSRIIVQIYDDSGYWVARRMGYREIVYTLFRQPKRRWARSIDFAAKHRIKFVSMSADRATRGLVRRARKKGLWVGIHPVNRTSKRSQLRKIGATHIYSSFLAP